jgi:hypothetical protein
LSGTGDSASLGAWSKPGLEDSLLRSKKISEGAISMEVGFIPALVRLPITISPDERLWFRTLCLQDAKKQTTKASLYLLYFFKNNGVTPRFRIESLLT